MANCIIRFLPPIFHFSIASLDAALMIRFRGPLPSCPDQIRGWLYGQFIIHFWEGIISIDKAFRFNVTPRRLGEPFCLAFEFVWLIYALIIGYRTIGCAGTYPVLYTTMAVGTVIIGVKSSRECKEQTSPPAQPLLSIPIIPAPVVFKDVKSAALNETCSFCMEEFDEDDSVVQLPCKHVYHPRVIRSWLATAQNCPLCRKPVDVQ